MEKLGHISKIILIILVSVGLFGCSKTAAVPDTQPPAGESPAESQTSAAFSGSKESSTAAEPEMTQTWIPEEETISEPGPSEEYQVISMEDYLEKTTSGLLAQFVGFLSGYEMVYDSNGNPRVSLPDDWFEICNGPYADPNPHNKHADKLLMNGETGLWEVWNDDDYSIDILNQYILADAFARYGTFSSKSIKDGWVNYDVWDMGGGNRGNGAYALMSKKEYLPVFSGSAEFGNLYTVYGEPYIENETLGMAAAGLPNVAVDMADVFARVTSDCDPVLWARFLAAMYAMAYFEDDIPTLIREAEVVLPEGSWQRQVIDQVFAIWEKYPDNWRDAVEEVAESCYRSHFDLGDKSMSETSINNAFILMGLLYGDGDYYETCRIMSLAGHGGDSTTPTGLGIVGIIQGMKDLPAEVNEKVWQDGKGVVVNMPYTDSLPKYYMYYSGLPERIPISDIVELYRRNFEHILMENGGKIEDGNYYIPKDPLRGMETVLTEDFEEGLGNWTVTGEAELAEPGFTGSYSAEIHCSKSHDNGISTTLTGLKPGAKYRVTAYVRSSAKTSAYLFAREPGADSGVFEAAGGYQSYVKRDFIFRATAETMEIGLILPAGTNESRNTKIDDITVVHVLEQHPLGDAVTIQSQSEDGRYAGKIEMEIHGRCGRELYLKITFANTMSSAVDVAMALNGEEYANIPFYPTGSTAAEEAGNYVYIPVILDKDVNTVVFDVLQTGTSALYIRGAEIVAVSDRW